VTPLEIVTDVNDIHLEKADSAMDVYPLGITTSPVGQLNQAAYDVTDDGMIDGGNGVPLKEKPPIVMTLVGIVTDVSDEQSLKA
jgi:hypothetical protein